MKDFNNSIPYWNEDSAHQQAAKQTAVAIQNISKNIREYSFRMRETVKALRETGAIPEIVLAIREGSFAVRDTMQDINATAQELRKNGFINDTANAVETTLENAEESITTVKEISSDVKLNSPKTTKAVKAGIDTIKQETNQVTTKVMESIRNRVAA